MQNILLFIDSLGSGGAQRQFVGLATFLKNRGYEVNVITYFDLPFYNHLLDDYNISHEVVADANNYLHRIPAIKKAIKKHSPDVVIAYMETPSIIASIIKLMGGEWKLIVSERNTSQINNWRESIRFNLFRVADFVVPNSFSQEYFINKYYPFLTKVTTTISNFVDTDFFTPAANKLINKKVEIVIAASIWESKNTVGLIEAVRILKKHTQNFHIKWYGKSESNMQYFNKSNNLINKYGLTDFIELLDKTSDIVTKYRDSDIFCLPSFYEGTPNVICEAMACGLPIACSDVCDNSIYVKNNENGWLFDPKSPDDIASKLYLAITTNQEERQAYSIASRKIAVDKLSKEEFLKKYITLLDKLN